MLELSLRQAYDLSGIYDDDSALVKDMKLQAWLERRRSRAVPLGPDLDSQRQRAREDGIEVLIIKET
jgi:hypothetical protein